MKTMRKVLAAMLAVCVFSSTIFSASAENVVQACTADPNSPNAISIGSATMAESEDYYILAEMPITLTVQMKREDLPASVRNTLRTTADTVDVPISAVIVVAQQKGTTKITTEVTVRPDNLLYNPLIRRVSISQKFVNYTETSQPTFNDSFTLSTSNPKNYISGTHTTNQSFTKGHTIAVTVTINSVIMDNAVWSGGPASKTQRVTIK